MQASAPLFLSYRSLERGFASRLAADLKAAALPVWMDCMDIPPGRNWDEAIADAIEHCPGLLAVLSPAYVASPVCLDELARAQRLGRPVLVVLLEPLADPNDWPLLVERRQFIDFGRWTDTVAYRARLDELLATIGRSHTFGPATPPDPEATYLNDLQARLEEARGVLQYVDLQAAAADPAAEPRIDESGFDAMLELDAPSELRRTTRWQDLEALLPRVRRLAILGDAGSGKTTTLRWLALRGALARRTRPRAAPLPVYASLAQWGDGQSFGDFIAAACPLLEAVPRPLAASDTLLLLDGLNEMGPSAATKAQALATWLAGQATPPLIAVTCRPAEFTAFGLTGFATASLRPLGPAQVRQFASRYLASSSDRFLEQVLPPLAARSGDPSLMAELARNPYALSALIYLFQAAPEAPLPDNPGVLFTRLATAQWTQALRRRQSTGRPALPAWTGARQVLAALALASVEGDEAEDLPLQRAEAALGAELLQAALDAGLLSRHGAFVRYAHNLLRMALAAQALADVDAPALDQWCRGHLRHWQQLTVAWSGIGAQADAFIELTQWQEAAQLVARGYVASDAALRKPIRRALEELAVDHWRSFEPAMNALRDMGRRCVSTLIEALAQADADLRAKLAFVLGSIGDERAVPALLALLDDPAGDVSGRALAALRRIASKAAWQALAANATHASAARRQAAAQALGKLAQGGDAGATVPLRTLLGDPDRDVRLAAIAAIGPLRDADSAEALHALLTDDDADTRAASLRALALIGHGDLRGAVQRALADGEPVRLAALDCTAALEPGAALAALTDALQSTSKALRLRAVDVLAGRGDARALALLGPLLDDPTVGATVARALGRVEGEAARAVLLRGLRGDEPGLWPPCAEALEASGWTPESPLEVVRCAAAKSNWSAALALGAAAVEDLRAVLQRGSEPMRRGAAATLQTLGWLPRRADAECFSFLVARADWETEGRQHPGQRPSLLAWFDGSAPAGGPVRALVASLLPALEAPLWGVGLEAALGHEEARVRQVAAVTCGLARCTEALPALLANLDTPADEPAYRTLTFDAVRIAAAQAIAEMGGTDAARMLLTHAACHDNSGLVDPQRSIAVTAIQGAARLLGVGEFFALVPGALLGRKPAADPAASGDPAEPGQRTDSGEMDLWLFFPLGDQTPQLLLQIPLPVLVKFIAEFDRSKLPDFSYLYADVAMAELHRRMAVLALGVMIVSAPEDDLRSLARQAMTRLWDWSVEPVLRELSRASVPALAEFARGEMARRGRG